MLGFPVVIAPFGDGQAYEPMNVDWPHGVPLPEVGSEIELALDRVQVVVVAKTSTVIRRKAGYTDLLEAIPVIYVGGKADDAL